MGGAAGCLIASCLTASCSWTGWRCFMRAERRRAKPVLGESCQLPFNILERAGLHAYFVNGSFLELGGDFTLSAFSAPRLLGRLVKTMAVP